MEHRLVGELYSYVQTVDSQQHLTKCTNARRAVLIGASTYRCCCAPVVRQCSDLARDRVADVLACNE